MNSPLDMSLDDLVKKSKQSKGQKRNITAPDDHARSRGRGGSGYGPTRRFRGHCPTMTSPYSSPHGHEKQEMNRRRKEGGAKLYVSNLHYQVSDYDIEVLFSDVGELKKYGIHYDESGRSKGTAEVVYKNRADALAAIERYNHLQLDGRPLKIDFIGVEFVFPAASPTDGMWRQSALERIEVRERKDEGGSHGFGQGQKRERKHFKVVSAEDLDADLEKYHFRAM